jgi:hypothetical protein
MRTATMVKPSIQQPHLFSYTIPYDDGAAPNPFNGMCTLAICKPAIRRTARKGDWIAGLGSANAPSGNLSNRLVYAMRVDKVVTIEEYDQRARSQWPHRVPDIKSKALVDRLGDCIYNYTTVPPEQRAGVHGQGNYPIDLGGENVLISWNFYYFGRNAKPLPNSLHPICHQTQGHKRQANNPYVRKFINWVQSLPEGPGQHGWPDMIIKWHNNGCSPCATREQDGACDAEC